MTSRLHLHQENHSEISACAPSIPRFNKLDFTALIIDKQFRTPAAVMAYVQDQASLGMQDFTHRHQRRLRDMIADAWEWEAARVTASKEAESDWQLLQRLARTPCSCSSGEAACRWSAACGAFFERNRATLNEEEFVACVAAVVQTGPSKTSRVPLLVGPTNAGKSTVFDPIDKVFGEEAVFHTPALGCSMPLANLAGGKKRFIYLDDYRPVEYASVPSRSPTLAVPTFLKLLGGQFLEITVSQSFNNGNADIKWQRGLVMTAKCEGLWVSSNGVVSPEDIRHMQSRVHQFHAMAQLPTEALRAVPPCPEGFSRWLLLGSAEAAARHVPRPLSSITDEGVAINAPLPIHDDEEAESSFFL